MKDRGKEGSTESTRYTSGHIYTHTHTYIYIHTHTHGDGKCSEKMKSKGTRNERKYLIIAGRFLKTERETGKRAAAVKSVRWRGQITGILAKGAGHAFTIKVGLS